LVLADGRGKERSPHGLLLLPRANITTDRTLAPVRPHCGLGGPL